MFRSMICTVSAEDLQDSLCSQWYERLGPDGCAQHPLHCGLRTAIRALSEAVIAIFVACELNCRRPCGRGTELNCAVQWKRLSSESDVQKWDPLVLAKLAPGRPNGSAVSSLRTARLISVDPIACQASKNICCSGKLTGKGEL